jgi:hypothetical protein
MSLLLEEEVEFGKLLLLDMLPNVCLDIWLPDASACFEKLNGNPIQQYLKISQKDNTNKYP